MAGVIACCVALVFAHSALQVGVSAAIVSISPAGVILSGGIVMTVTGTDLNRGTTTPQLVITAQYGGGTFTFTGEDCTVVTSASLTCPSPVITPDTITGYTLPTVASQRILNVVGSLTFSVGVLWSTGLVDHGAVTVYKDPELTMQYAQRTFTIWTDSIVRISGLALDGTYISNMSDYRFTIANLDCPTSYLNSTWLSCSIPTTIPDRENYEDKSPFNFAIGNFQQQLGNIHYRVPVFDDETDRYQDHDPTDLAHRVTATGHYLMVGLNHSSYHVQIGVGECSDIVVSTTHLSCRPPPTAPAPLAAYPLMGQLPQMVITVPKDSSEAVFQYIYHATYIKYGDTTDENEPGLPSVGQVTEETDGGQGDSGDSDTQSDSWKWIVVGVCAFVAVSFLAVLCCCLCCSDLCPLGKRRIRWVEKEAFNRMESDSNQTPRSSIRSYQTRTTSSMYPTVSQLYHISNPQDIYRY